MSRNQWVAVLGLAGLLFVATTAEAQVRPYIGFAYPAGGQRGTTFLVRVGGQGMDGVSEAVVSGRGVSAKVLDYFRRLNNEEMALLRAQLTELKQGSAEKSEATLTMIDRIEKRFAENVTVPACASLSSLVFLEVTMSADAEPGPRELRVITSRGVSNPLVFHVGQVPEICRKPMLSATIQVLGKEELALRKRPADEIEQRVSTPCTVNGQIASGEVNRYRFEARKGQRLVLTTEARQLIPYIADAVPGWFQPVLTIHDARGKEVAYNDDYRFRPDPIIFFDVPQDGEYVFSITDAIYRGREDFVYRVTIGEMPFITSIFPLGARAGHTAPIQIKGWNLGAGALAPPTNDADPGIHLLAASKDGMASNRVPFALDTLPESFDKEPNNDPPSAQKVKLPIIVNGRIDRPDDWDVFQFQGHAGDTVVAEVMARRLDSPLDSLLKLTDSSGTLLALNDDKEELGAGVNTHQADSYLMVKLPADGTYYVHVGDTARSGGEAYAYRLRISAPRPDFELRVVPSSITLRSKVVMAVNVHVVRKDGFAEPIKLRLKNPPEGITSLPLSLPATQDIARLNLKTTLIETKQPLDVHIEGFAKVGDLEIVREATPAEDRMQAFLWRHLVPAADLKLMVIDPTNPPPPKRFGSFKTPNP